MAGLRAVGEQRAESWWSKRLPAASATAQGPVRNRERFPVLFHHFLRCEKGFRVALIHLPG